MLEAGRWAPSSDNSQPWEFIIVNDMAIIANLAEIKYRQTKDNPPQKAKGDPVAVEKLAQSQKKIIPQLPKARHQAITMPVTEAIESLTINLSNFVNPRTKLSEIIPEIKINARSFVLVYVPFKEGHHEFIQPDLQIAINKNILVHSKNL